MPLFAQVADATANPALGVLIFALGGLAGAVFYLPFKKVKGWAWESYWLIYAVFGLIVVPWVLALVTSPNVVSVLKASPGKELGYCFLCGAMWGVGGLTWGLMIRYLGVGLGLAIGCGLCSAAGTLVPPAAAKAKSPCCCTPPPAWLSLGRRCWCRLIGIVLVGGAGMSKENELPEEVKKATVAEYNFKMGLIVAIFSGLMSAGMNFGLQGGATIEKLAQTVEPVTEQHLERHSRLGGRAAWADSSSTSDGALLLNVKNHTAGDYVNSATPLGANLFFAGLAGVLWCSQMICFKTGEPAMGKLSYIGWSVLIASMILFSTLLGIFLGEWRNTSARTRWLLAIGLMFLAASSVRLGL